MHVPRQIQISEQSLRIVEVTVQVVLREQQRNVLVRFPLPAVFSGHPQPPAVYGEVSVVFRKPIDRHPRPRRERSESQCVVAAATYRELATGGTQPVEHLAQVVVAKLPADKPVQGEAIPKGRRLGRLHSPHHSQKEVPPARVICNPPSATNVSHRKRRFRQYWSHARRGASCVGPWTWPIGPIGPPSRRQLLRDLVQSPSRSRVVRHRRSGELLDGPHRVDSNPA